MEVTYIKVKHEVGSRKKIAAIAIEKRWTLACKLSVNLLVEICKVFGIAKQCWLTICIVLARSFVTWIIDCFTTISFESDRAFATVNTK